MTGNTAAGSASEIYDMINGRQKISFNDLSDMAFSMGMGKDRLRKLLDDLERMKVIASSSRGGVLTYYPLQGEGSVRKVLIVEDDKNINKLMALSIGKGFEVKQIYDGGEAMPFIRENKPDLVILDLMLPHKDGLDICDTIKKDPSISNTVVILVSAMDPTSNRFKGLKIGADYYIKKPFEPTDLRSLVTIFLKKKGNRFDPLIDLPDEEGISKEIEHSIKEGEEYSIGTVRIGSIGDYAKRLGANSAMVILRLVSQLLQDISKNNDNVFVGFLDSEVFVVGGPKKNVASGIEKLKEEFDAVMQFILQDEGYKPIDINIDDVFESKKVPRLSIIYEETNKEKIRERRNKILKDKRSSKNNDIGSYTYDEIRRMFGNEDLDIRITRGENGVKLQVSKEKD